VAERDGGAEIDAGALADLAPGTARRVTGHGHQVCVVRIGDDVYAIGDVCSHADVSLADGEVWADECEIECPKHGSTFSLTTGEPQTLPATQPVPVYDARVVDGRIVVRVGVTAGSPTIEEARP
jgi:3-phenylpropionate/trans-cinnamate dioxygenase ferredoxin subunit